ncbi:MAG: C40 family peptidase [bacterium]|nr:C40 family peptidase [bacterium]
MKQTAVITVPIADLWSLPEFNSERVNQALYGDDLQIVRKKAGFAHVKLFDGYRGWVDIRFLRLKSNRYRHPNYQVTARMVRVKSASGRLEPPYRLYYGSRIAGRKVGHAQIRLSGQIESPLYLNFGQLRPIIRNMKTAVSGVQLGYEARKFLGVPYLWGGKSPVGFDCSGFMQAIFDRFGIQIPRDTKEQIACGEPVARELVQAGDLLFFDRHVALALNRMDYIHSSIGGSGVAINSFEKRSSRFREDLNRDFVQARRVL